MHYLSNYDFLILNIYFYTQKILKHVCIRCSLRHAMHAHHILPCSLRHTMLFALYHTDYMSYNALAHDTIHAYLGPTSYHTHYTIPCLLRHTYCLILAMEMVLIRPIC